MGADEISAKLAERLRAGTQLTDAERRVLALLLGELTAAADIADAAAADVHPWRSGVLTGLLGRRVDLLGQLRDGGA